MDGMDLKRATVDLFLVLGIFPYHFYGGKMCVHFDIWNEIFFQNFQNYLAHFSNLDLAKNLKNDPNLNFEKLKKIFYARYQNVHIFPPKTKPQLQ